MDRVTVRYFAALRDRKGRDREEVDLRPGETAAALYARLFPPGPEGTLPVAFARNHEAVAGGTVLADGDEVAFLPPIGGG